MVSFSKRCKNANDFLRSKQTNFFPVLFFATFPLIVRLPPHVICLLNWKIKVKKVHQRYISYIIQFANSLNYPLPDNFAFLRSTVYPQIQFRLTIISFIIPSKLFNLEKTIVCWILWEAIKSTYVLTISCFSQNTK